MRAQRCAGETALGRAVRSSACMTGNPLDAAPPDILEFLREEGIRAVEELSAGNDDRVDGSPAAGGQLPEHLSNQSLSSVTLHRSAYLPRSDDAEAGTTARGWQQQQCEETALKAGATIENLLKLGAASNAALARKAIGRPGAAGVRRLHYRAPASALPRKCGPIPTKPSGACGPWPDGASARGAPSSWPCARGSRACDGGAGCLAEKCVCLSYVGTPVARERVRRKPRW